MSVCFFSRRTPAGLLIAALVIVVGCRAGGLARPVPIPSVVETALAPLPSTAEPTELAEPQTATADVGAGKVEHAVLASPHSIVPPSPQNPSLPLPTPIAQTQYQQQDEPSSQKMEADARSADSEAQLASLVGQALAVHPEIRRLRASAGEAWARVPQARSLPDPMASGTVYGEPMMMADGETRGTLMFSQTIPSLRGLDARGQQATIEAMITQQSVRAAEQRIVADVREAWYRLYLLEQLLRINDANEQLIESLVTIASAQVEVGRATSGDVILGTVELSRVAEERLQLRQQRASRAAVLNRLLNRPADAPVETPEAIHVPDVALSLEMLRPLAAAQQPEIVQARLRTQATAWGIRVAKLERVPNVTLSYERMFMSMEPAAHGSDPWQLGAGINLPLWHQKYDALRQEAAQRHAAAHAGTEEVTRANEAMLLDYSEQAAAADRIAELYRQTVVPQLTQALEADQRAYGQGAVQFERLIANARNLLTARAAYHRALADRAIALARLEQTVGAPLPLAEFAASSSAPDRAAPESLDPP